MEKKDDEGLSFISLDHWTNTELPWIVFWIKELITWGTYDPVVAYLLSSNIATTREEASTLAQDYYSDVGLTEDIFNAKQIRKWTLETFSHKDTKKIKNDKEFSIEVELAFKNKLPSKKLYRVFPTFKNGRVYWVDYGGYLMAESQIDFGQIESAESFYEFMLDQKLSRVLVRQFSEKF